MGESQGDEGYEQSYDRSNRGVALWIGALCLGGEETLEL